MSKITILTIDGGGIKGIIPAYFLQAIEKKLNKPCYQLFDIIGGTSTGGIIATALTTTKNNPKPLTAEEVLHMYKDDGASIFSAQGEGFIEAKYYASHHGKGIEPFLQSKLGDSTLSEAKSKMSAIGGRVKHVFTTSYTINSTGGKISDPKLKRDYGPYLFNWQDAANNAHDNYAVWEAARATSAAPTYFPIAHLGGGGDARSNAQERRALDGGVMSNNPTIWAVTEAFRTGLTTTLSDITVISLGTGIYPSGAGLVTSYEGHFVPEKGNWGVEPWVGIDLWDLAKIQNGRGAIINILMDAVQMVSNQQMQALVKSGLTYYRLEPSISQAESKMDDTSSSNIAALEQTAKNYINTDPKGKGIFRNIIHTLQADS